MSQSLPALTRLAKQLHPHTWGKAAEKMALLILLCRGYRPFRPQKRMWVQTDLLLTKGHILAVVEVKARTHRSRGHIAVHPAQKARLNKQISALAGMYPHYTLRLDLFLVFPHWPFFQHIQGV